ncbi:MAG: insulinase family protein [Verrucomicrobiales bacterium]|nr:insulinase family protein [Verrucomicrobiales bacterium]
MSISASLITATNDAQVTALDNGLVVIVREDNSAPVVSAQVWCRAGSVDEGRWLGAGLSHVLEHMLFKGTTTRGAGRIDQEVQDAGGYMNAYTSFDRTVYWINVPNTGTRVAVDILCDIVQHATLPEGELVKELDVIRREMDMCHDDPGRRSSRQLFETAYTRSAYRYPVIGIPDIFNTITREDVLTYYREKYAPNNLFLVVVGDVKAGEVMSQVGEAFAGVKARPVPQSPLVEEPRQTAPRQRIEEASIELGYLHDSWHIPELRHPDVPALDVLSVILGSGRSSRLFREVREKAGLVHSADAWTYNPGSPGLFGVSAVADGDRFEAASQAILNEVRKLSDAAPSEAELAKAIKQITAGTLAVRKTMQGQAQDLGSSWLTVGDLGYSARYLASVEKVTCAQMQRMAQTYLQDENRTTCALLPTGFKPKVTALMETALKTPITRLVLPNGLRLLVKEDHRLPFVELRSVFQGGVLTESLENNGVTGLMTKMLIKGAGRRSAEEISSEIESVGGSLDVYAGNNSFGVAAEVLEADLGLGLELMADVLLRPTFPESEVEREREYQLAGIRAQKDQLLQVAARTMRRALFGDRGYGLDSMGTEESVASLTLDQLRKFHRRLTVPNNGVLAIYGRVDTASIRRAVEAQFGDWAPGNPELLAPRDSLELSESIRKEEYKDKKQAVVVLGFPGVTMRNPDRHALELLQEACSDLGSRLFMRIRDDLGLAYYVGAQNFIGLEPGFFSFYAGTEPGKVPLVVEELMAEAAKLSMEGLTAEELKRSKAKIIGQKKIARQDLGGYAMTTALDELYGLGYAHSDAEDALYEAVSLDDVKRVATRVLNVKATVLSIVSPPPAA